MRVWGGEPLAFFTRACARYRMLKKIIMRRRRYFKDLSKLDLNILHSPVFDLQSSLSLYLLPNPLRHISILESAHVLVCLLRQAEGQNCMWQNAGQVGVEALVDGKEAFGADGFDEAVPGAGVQVAGLVVHA